MAGSEVIENGLPSHDALTIYGLGAIWTDQQWLAQVFMYGVYSLGGFALLSIVTCASVVGAFALAAGASRSLGAGARAIWLLFLPVLVSAALGWSIRAQMLTLPLYTGLLWLLAAQARRPTNRVWIALPMLVLWANMHGSAALGALLVVLLGGYELVRSRGGTWKRSLALIVAAPLAILATPYGPVTTARYYHLVLVDPPFAGQVTEWRWPEPASNTYVFYVLLAMAVPLVIWGRRRLTAFDIGVLALTLAGALTAIRGIPWFAFACMVFVPVAIGRSLESRKPGEPSVASTLVVCILLSGRDRRLRRRAVPPQRRVVRGLLAERACAGDSRRAAAGRPCLRSRSLLGLAALEDPGAPRAHRVRRALRDLRQSVLRSARQLQLGARQRLEVVRGRLPDRRRRRDESVAHRRLPEGAGARGHLQERRADDHRAPAQADPPASACDARNTTTLSPLEHLLPRRIALESSNKRPYDLRMPREDRRVGPHDPRIAAIDDDPLGLGRPSAPSTT